MNVRTLVCAAALFAAWFAAAEDVQHPRGAYAEIGGAKIWYEVEGEGEPLLLIPGGPGSSHLNFHPYFSPLAVEHRVIYVDLFGRGKSDRAASPKQYSFRRDVDTVEGLRKHLGIERMNVLGFSYGSLVAEAYAIEHPQNVARLVLLSPLYSGAMWQARNERFAYESRNQFPETWAKLSALRSRGLHERSPELGAANDIPLLELLFFYDPKNVSRLRRDAVSSNPEIAFALGGDDVSFQLRGAVRRVDFTAKLGTLRMPLLVLAGRFDRVFPPAETLAIRRFAPRAEVVLFEKSGHYPQIEETEKFVAALRDFLAR